MQIPEALQSGELGHKSKDRLKYKWKINWPKREQQAYTREQMYYISLPLQRAVLAHQMPLTLINHRTHQGHPRTGEQVRRYMCKKA